MAGQHACLSDHILATMLGIETFGGPGERT